MADLSLQHLKAELAVAQAESAPLTVQQWLLPQATANCGRS
jgi:hypothetical protein